MIVSSEKLVDPAANVATPRSFSRCSGEAEADSLLELDGWSCNVVGAATSVFGQLMPHCVGAMDKLLRLGFGEFEWFVGQFIRRGDIGRFVPPQFGRKEWQV
jgi:hypothetical protein